MAQLLPNMRAWLNTLSCWYTSAAVHWFTTRLSSAGETPSSATRLTWARKAASSAVLLLPPAGTPESMNVTGPRAVAL